MAVAGAMKVLWIDPGEKVGWAHAAVKNAVWVGTPAPEGGVKISDKPAELKVTGHGISHLKDFALKLHEVAGDYDLIGYERYRISGAHVRRHVGSDVPTLQLIGMIRLCAWVGGVKIVEQDPGKMATADKVIPVNFPDIQRRLDELPKTHDEAHDGSALRHLAYWFWKEYV